MHYSIRKQICSIVLRLTRALCIRSSLDTWPCSGLPVTHSAVLGSFQLEIIRDEHSKYCCDVADSREVERRLVVILGMPDARERIADQVNYRHSCANNITLIVN